MRLFKMTLATAALATVLTAGLAADAQSVRKTLDGTRDCIEPMPVSQSGSYYYANFRNWCQTGIWVDITRYNQNGELVRDDGYVPAADRDGNPGTTKINIYFSPDFRWSERF